MTAIMLMILIITPPSMGKDDIKVEITTSKSEYLSNENLVVYYCIYLPDGRIVDGGKGEWFLVYNWNDSEISHGLLNNSQGRITVDLSNYNLTSMGYGDYLRFKLDYLYNNVWYNNSKLIKVISVGDFYFSINTNPISGGYYPESYVKIRIKSPVGLLDVRWISIYSENRKFMNVSNPMKLDIEGHGNYYFKIPEDVEINSKINVSAEIENKIETVNFTVSKNFGFYFYSDVNLGEEVLSGERINLTVMSSEEVSGEYFHYYVYDYNHMLIEHLLTDNRNFTYKIPKNYTGYMEIKCDIYNSTENIGTLIQILNVANSKMYVYFDKLTYTRGDTLHFYVNFQSMVVTSPQFAYNIFEDYGNGYLLLKSISTKKSDIEIKVPENPPLKYKVEVHLMSNVSSTIKSAEIEYSIPLAFRAYILSKSPYVNGVFTPGQKIEIHFKIMNNYVRGGILYYGFDDEFYTTPQILILGNQTEGNIIVKIPKYAKSGIYEIHLMLVYDKGEKSTSIFINVNSNPPWSLYGIFGIPLGDFIVIIILIVLVVAVFLYLYPKKKEEKNDADIKDSQ